MDEERQSDLIMAGALAKTLGEVVERLDHDICRPSTLDELRDLADRVDSELEDEAA